MTVCQDMRKIDPCTACQNLRMTKCQDSRSSHEARRFTEASSHEARRLATAQRRRLVGFALLDLKARALGVLPSDTSLDCCLEGFAFAFVSSK